MAGPFLIAILTLLIACACFRLTVLLYKRYNRKIDDVERDIETFAIEVQLQLQHEFQDAIQDNKEDWGASLPSAHSVTTQDNPKNISCGLIAHDWWRRFHENQFSGEKETDLITSKQLSAQFDNQWQRRNERPETRHLEALPDSLDAGVLGQVEAPIFVNAKQFRRILKRRQTRMFVEEYLQSKQRERKADLRNAGTKGCMRWPRGPTGRFLIPEGDLSAKIKM